MLFEFFSDNFLYTTSFGGNLDTLNDFFRNYRLSLIWYNCFDDYWFVYVAKGAHLRIYNVIYKFLHHRVGKLYVLKYPDVVLESILAFCKKYFTEKDAFAFVRSLVVVDSYVFSGVIYFKGNLSLGTHFYNLRFVFDFCVFCSLLHLDYEVYCGSKNINGIVYGVKEYVRKSYFFLQRHELS